MINFDEDDNDKIDLLAEMNDEMKLKLALKQHLP